jgi:AcrR family transcriptional regulator
LSVHSTKDRILDVSEHLFADKGYSATSMRNITAEAGANLAAVNYHFGSKEALLVAVLERRLTPLNRERLEGLDAEEARAGDGPPDLEKILRAFFGPALRMRRDLGEKADAIMRLAGRAHSNPDERVRTLFMDLFQEIRQRFISAFQRALPESPPEEVFWRFFFVIGAMAHTLVWGPMIEMIYYGRKDATDIEAVLERLVTFAAAGMRAPMPVLEPGDRR